MAVNLAPGDRVRFRNLSQLVSAHVASSRIMVIGHLEGSLGCVLHLNLYDEVARVRVDEGLLEGSLIDAVPLAALELVVPEEATFLGLCGPCGGLRKHKLGCPKARASASS